MKTVYALSSACNPLLCYHSPLASSSIHKYTDPLHTQFPLVLQTCHLAFLSLYSPETIAHLSGPSKVTCTRMHLPLLIYVYLPSSPLKIDTGSYFCLCVNAEKLCKQSIRTMSKMAYSNIIEMQPCYLRV